MRPDQCHGHKETSPAPLRFALVPADEMPPQYLANNAAGNDLLQRIVRARDNLQSVRDWDWRWSEACDVMDAVNALAVVLNELGGCDG